MCLLEKTHKLQECISYSAVFCEFSVNKLTAHIRDFPGSPVVKTPYSQCLVGKLRSHVLHSVAKQINKSRVCQNGFLKVYTK